MAIPVIDFSKVNGKGEKRAKAQAEIAHGCEDGGVFQLVTHGIPQELLDRVKRVCEEFFKKLEREEDFKNSAKSGENLENMDSNDDITLLRGKDWPLNTPGFKETMAEYRAELKKLAERLVEVMDESLGLPPKGYIKITFNYGGEDSAFFGTKVRPYPPCPHPEHVNGLRAHTDAGGVILLLHNGRVCGLQILKDGQWIDVQPLNLWRKITKKLLKRIQSLWLVITCRSIPSFLNSS